MVKDLATDAGKPENNLRLLEKFLAHSEVK
jgi:hypothetical protein